MSGAEADPSCGLTVLRCAERSVATKTQTRQPGAAGWIPTGYKAGLWFEPTEHHFTNLREMADLIDAVRTDPRAFLVRGELAPEIRAEIAKRNGGCRILRRKDKKGDVEPTLVEVPRFWCMVDIDKWPLPSWADLVAEPDMVVDHAIHTLLPAEFRDAQSYWHLSSSAGFAANVVSIHLFFWLSEPATSTHVKAALARLIHGHGRDSQRSVYNALM